MKLKAGLLVLLLTMAASARAEDGRDLFAAAMMGKVERTEALLAEGIDVNSKTPTGRTALMAASYNGNVQIVKMLLAYGADVSIADNSGTTALMDALVFGDEDIVNALIAAGADVNALDKQNQTVLARAKRIGRENIIKILENAGATAEEEVPIEEATPKEGEEGNAPAGTDKKTADKK